MSEKRSENEPDLESAFAVGVGIGAVNKVMEDFLGLGNQSKRTYSGYGKALDGAHNVLDPEERVAVRHTYFIIFLTGIAISMISPDLGLIAGICAAVYHLGKVRLESKRGEI